MASTCTQTLFGFDCGLDWRPTTFVKAIPSTRVCNACGLVPAKAVTLPCRHLLCLSCYCRNGIKRNCCPLDGAVFQQEDVAISVYRKDSVLSRTVRCWNAQHGCDAEDLAPSMMKHFATDCRFHVVRCSRCYDKFLHTDLADHLQSCRASSSSPGQPSGDNLVNAFLEVKDALRKISEENASMKARLESIEELLSSDRGVSVQFGQPILNTRIATHEQRLSSVQGSYSKAKSKTVANVMAGTAQTTGATLLVEKDATRHEGPTEADVQPISTAAKNFMAASERKVFEFSELSNRFMDSLKNEFMKALIEERNKAPGKAKNDSRQGSVLSEVSLKIGSLESDMAFKKTMSGKDFSKALKLLGVACLGVTNDAFNVSAPLEWTVDDWACREESSGECGSLTCVSPCAYFYGYLIGFRLTIHEHSGELTLTPCALGGIYDDFLTWPPSLVPMVRFVHPTDFGSDIIVGGGDSWKNGATKTTYHFREVLFEGPILNISLRELKESNLIRNDQLRLQFELYRPNTDHDRS
ncbi:uncharacterized protein LOC119393456 [Rhipicephalus sanguineus]|uniref:Uncharacterized protein n=1 Tax=Rhipicephalus sanguineus TaxID=34632 RepID=A0A9D4SUK3_RHISA|nr:uncharacterized protein LOC119393456 [Rhipicephalus sanguineus]KAH7951999.1 hypothetical protein HPB52_016689 [Rhipicephalus sanguineus]